MNAKPTPGPWHLSEETERDGLRSRLVHGMPEGMLAIVRVEHQGGYYGDANARLIAAAPDMLAALQLVEPILGHGPVTQETIEAYKAVADAIARANGMPVKAEQE